VGMPRGAAGRAVSSGFPMRPSLRGLEVELLMPRAPQVSYSDSTGLQ